jgi:CRP-like cAMP-binding protein
MFENPILNFPIAKKRTRILEKGEYVFHQFDPVDAIYFLQSGRVQMKRNLENGQSVAIHTLVTGESFAEAALFANHYHCDAVSTEKSTVIQISKAAILARLRTEPDYALNLLKLTSGQVQHYRQRIQILTINSAEDRILAALSSGIPHDTVIELASSIGLTHETCYRALHRLEQKGLIIKLGRGKYRLA